MTIKQSTNIFICGDIINTKNRSLSLCDEKMKSIISQSDYSICNLEAPLQTNSQPIRKIGANLAQLPTTIEMLKLAGFDHCLLANNHMMDFGEEGINGTIKEIRKNGLEYSGAGLCYEDVYRPTVIRIKDKTIGLINCCEAQFGVIDYSSSSRDAGYAWVNHRKIKSVIYELKSKCDYILLLPHAGLENVDIPLLYWKQKYREFCDAGVDAIIASHPHVPQGYEKYKNSLIFYSLGNFYFDIHDRYIKESYSIILKIMNNGLDFEIVNHAQQDENVVYLEEPKDVSIEKLNKLLHSDYKDLYFRTIVEQATLLERLRCISDSRFNYDGNIVSTIKGWLSSLIGRRKRIDKPLLQYHLLKNETYHSIIKENKGNKLL
ncbi:CapA family protein [Vibrio breoganii]